ncbi:7664_t:CDS:2 [Ambispora leptoticha]|uniref:7664_t:CDS:1 n=1 Tax=Ambispora leptoticha TaxID=144679 RepID=A0A9N8ZT79_9GLOM|nr:7664_t:CDS:2 [Ambispora leptoticha]
MEEQTSTRSQKRPLVALGKELGYKQVQYLKPYSQDVSCTSMAFAFNHTFSNTSFILMAMHYALLLGILLSRFDEFSIVICRLLALPRKILKNHRGTALG